MSMLLKACSSQFYVYLKTSDNEFQTSRATIGGQDLRMTYSTSISDIYVPSKACDTCITTNTYYKSDESKLLNRDVLSTFVHYTEQSFMTYNWNYSITGDLVEDKFELQEIESSNPMNLVFTDI